jgi:protein-tyrosine phosphatase
MNVLFICNGNICRSPIAAALLRKKFEDKNIPGEVSSAGFESFNINEPPDPIAVKIAKKYNLDLNHKARIFIKKDFENFDKIYVMDTRNYRDVKELARNKEDLTKIDYLMNVIEPGKNKTIADPSMSGHIEIETIYNLLDKATDKILEIALKN